MSSRSYSRVLGIAGQICSGKTSLAKELGARLAAQRVSFGQYVSKEAVKRGIPTDREHLQELGEQLLAELGPTRFVQLVFEDAGAPKEGWLVVDGIRHLEVSEAIRGAAQHYVLLYLEVPQSERLRRLEGRDGLPQETNIASMDHPMELRIPQLSRYADLTLPGEPVSEWVDKVGRFLDRFSV